MESDGGNEWMEERERVRRVDGEDGSTIADVRYMSVDGLRLK
jgi:hypothetical protein